MGTPPEVDIISRLNPDQTQPLLGDCNLHTGSGVIVFRAGRARAPIAVARKLLETRNDIEVPALAHEKYGPDATSQPDQGNDEGQQAEPALLDRLAELEHQLANARAELAAKNGGETTTPPTEDEAVREERLRAAREHLKAEGLEVPEPVKSSENPEGEVARDGIVKSGPPSGPAQDIPGKPPIDDKSTRGPVPAGFTNQTPEGELRCLAHKNDGDQCKNAAVDGGNACGLGPHQAQFAT